MHHIHIRILPSFLVSFLPHFEGVANVVMMVLVVLVVVIVVVVR